MSYKELIQTIQNDIKNLDKCIEMFDTEEGVDYLKSIQQNLREQEIKLTKKMSIEKAIKEQQPTNIISYVENQDGSYHSSTTPTHYQGTIQPIDLINAQDLNFNLGNVVKYVCRAGKKQGENILSDLEKAKDYINFEIERVKK